MCGIGEYQDQTGQSSCNKCSIGEYQDQQGQSTCSVCPADSDSMSIGQFGCDCIAGHFSSSGYADSSESCVPCGSGEYQEHKTQTSCKSCAHGKYEVFEGQPTCSGLCPIGTTTEGTGSTNITDCRLCAYPYTTNTEGSPDCPAIWLNAKYSAYAIWFGLGFMFAYELLDSCYYDVVLTFRVLVFGELVVITSWFDFVSDLYFILNETFYNEYLFYAMVASLGISLFIFPRVLFQKKLYPTIYGEHIDKFFPGFWLISKNLIFITYARDRYITVRSQVVFTRPLREDIEKLSKDDLEMEVNKYGLEIDGEVIDRSMFVDKLDAFYDSDDWNPFHFEILRDLQALWQLLLYIVLVIFLHVLQLFNLISYVLLHFVMLLRIPLALALMVFFSSTKLIFLRKTWNKLMYFWTLDESKLRVREEGHSVDLALLHSVKQQEVVLEVSVQFILQLANAVLRGRLSTAYIVSAAAAAFDWLSCLYRYGWYSVHHTKIEDTTSMEVMKIEGSFTQLEIKAELHATAVQDTTRGSFVAGAWTATRTVYDWASKLDEVFTLDVAAYDERVAEETMKQMERVIDFLPKSSNGGLYTEDDIRVATTKVIDQFKNAKVSLDVDVEDSNSLGMDTRCREVEIGEIDIKESESKSWNFW